MSAYADKLHKRYEKGTATAEDLEERAALMNYYQSLVDAGQPLVTAPVRRLMGVAEPNRRKGAPSKVLDMIADVQARRKDEADRCAEIEVAAKSITDSAKTCADAIKHHVEDVIETAEQIVDNHRDPELSPRREYTKTDADVALAIGVLDELSKLVFTEDASVYEERCDAAMKVIRDANGGFVPKEYESLASEVIEKVEDYIDAVANDV
jgi:hypothetical protein